MREPSPLLIPTDRAAETLGCKKTKLFELIAQREVETVLLGRRRMVVAASLASFVDRLRAEQHPSIAA